MNKLDNNLAEIIWENAMRILIMVR